MHADRYHDLFADDSELADHRYVLQDRYLELTREVLPERARAARWVIKNDHCFMRVILDQLFNDCWYNHLDTRLVAYKQLTVPQLKRAIAMAERIESEGDVVLRKWNSESLAWRNKAKTRLKNRGSMPDDVKPAGL